MAGKTTVGMIAMWDGWLSEIPPGWQLCDGTNGTPDLRGRFVVGAGAAYYVGQTGGVEKYRLPEHTHGTETWVWGDENFEYMGQKHYHCTSRVSGYWDDGVWHTYRSYDYIYTSIFDSGSDLAEVNPMGSDGCAIKHYHKVNRTSSTTSTHTHGNNGNVDPEGEDVDNMPRYYAVAFIMRVV